MNQINTAYSYRPEGIILQTSLLFYSKNHFIILVTLLYAPHCCHYSVLCTNDNTIYKSLVPIHCEKQCLHMHVQ